MITRALAHRAVRSYIAYRLRVYGHCRVAARSTTCRCSHRYVDRRCAGIRRSPRHLAGPVAADVSRITHYPPRIRRSRLQRHGRRMVTRALAYRAVRSYIAYWLRVYGDNLLTLRLTSCACEGYCHLERSCTCPCGRPGDSPGALTTHDCAIAFDRPGVRGTRLVWYGGRMACRLSAYRIICRDIAARQRVHRRSYAAGAGATISILYRYRIIPALSHQDRLGRLAARRP